MFVIYLSNLFFFLKAFESWPERPFFGVREEGTNRFKFWKYKEVEVVVNNFCNGLKRLSWWHEVERPMVCLAADVSPSYVAAAFSCIYSGLPHFPLQCILPAESLAAILKVGQPEVSCFFSSSNERSSKQI
jgi:long-subunit acyl-CoA synthetase (AMP-forming)